MVHIVTGDINSGKTTKLLSLYQELNTGDGFILPKVYIEGHYAGQQILRLSTRVSRPFSFKTGYIPDYWNEKYRYDVYSFSQEGFDFAYTIVQDIVDHKASPVFIDEIGPLELQGKGFFQLLSPLLIGSHTIYLSVRATHLENVVKKFGIENYEVIKV